MSVVSKLLAAAAANPVMVAALFVAILVGAVLVFIKKQKHSLPRGYVYRRIPDEEMPKHPNVIFKDPYHRSKLPKEIDVIVVGSGLGGLVTAAYLSRVGKRCLVIEQHGKAGGCTHMFNDGGYEFDTGVHYVGHSFIKNRILLDLVTENPIEWDEMGRLPWDIKGCYDEVMIGDKVYPLTKDNFVEDLAKIFPEERENIIKWQKLCHVASKNAKFFKYKIVQPQWLATLLNKFACGRFFEFTNTTALDMVKKITKNEELQAVLVAQFGDYGRSPSTGTFFLQGCVSDHYMRGGIYPRGGSTQFAEQLIPTIERAGGRVLTKMPVKEIIIENGKCTGVELGNGDRLYAETVVSGAGLLNTCQRLVDPKYIPQPILKRVEALGPSCSMVYLFVGMNADAEKLKLRSSNIWKWPSGDYDQMLKNFSDDPLTADVPVFIGFPTAKDSTCTERFPGRSTAVILTICDHAFWESWTDTEKGKRGKEYEDLKKKIGERMLEEFLKIYPHCREHVDYTDVGTSLTFNHYLNSVAGEVYGLDTDSSRFQAHDIFRPDSLGIPGLYLTGQDVSVIGLSGAMMSGLLTAMTVLGYGGIGDIISGRNLVHDMIRARKMEKKAAEAAAATKKAQ